MEILNSQYSLCALVRAEESFVCLIFSPTVLAVSHFITRYISVLV